MSEGVDYNQLLFLFINYNIVFNNRIYTFINGQKIQIKNNFIDFFKIHVEKKWLKFKKRVIEY